MTTYIYETVPEREGAPVKHYEIRQSMRDAALTKHPETGEKIRRVVTGGYGFIKAGGTSAAPSAPASHCCGGGGCGCH